jgi:hypothetical protein
VASATKGSSGKLIYRLGLTPGAQLDTEMVMAYGKFVVSIVRFIISKATYV